MEGQMGFFDTAGASEGGEPSLPHADDFPPQDKLAMEKEVTGMYLSGHPMASYSTLYRTGAYARIDEIFLSAEREIEKYQDDQRVTLLAIITGVKKKITKSNASMAFVTLEAVSYTHLDVYKRQEF